MKPLSVSVPQLLLERRLPPVPVWLTGLLLLTAALFAGLASPSQLVAAVLAAVALGWLIANVCERTSHPTMRDSGLDIARLPDCQTCRELLSNLAASGSYSDPVFRELLSTQLAALNHQIRDWSHGRVTFTGTEAWRTAYEKVLTAPDIHEYCSVAWLKSEHYWRDRPGNRGMQVNFEILDQGVRIERILILGWNVWPPELRLPRESIRRWIDEQYYRGVSILLVRECDLINEHDLLCDFGIYGSRAVGELHVDDESRTVSFTLSFEQGAVELARERWARLKLFAHSYADLLDQLPSAR